MDVAAALSSSIAELLSHSAVRRHFGNLSILNGEVRAFFAQASSCIAHQLFRMEHDGTESKESLFASFYSGIETLDRYWIIISILSCVRLCPIPDTHEKGHCRLQYGSFILLVCNDHTSLLTRCFQCVMSDFMVKYYHCPSVTDNENVRSETIIDTEENDAMMLDYTRWQFCCIYFTTLHIMSPLMVVVGRFFGKR